jgi:hypothetical protein
VGSARRTDVGAGRALRARWARFWGRTRLEWCPQRVVNRAKALGWRVYRTWRSDHSPAGFPDLILCKPPRLLAVELKVKRNQLSEQQVAWLTDLALCRTVETLAAWPADYDALCKLLEAEESARPPGGRGGE